MAENYNALEHARQLVGQYPELTWMVTGSPHTTPENTVQASGTTVGAQLFPVAEFDRAYTGIAAMEWVRTDNYDQLTACQQPAVRLGRDSFDWLRRHTDEVLPDASAVSAMETFIAINDLGKIGAFVDEVKQMPGAPDTVDHDVVMHYGLQERPELSPSFAALSPEYQQKILDGMGTKFNLGQFMQAEGVAASLEGLAGVEEGTQNFYLLHTLYDIAGAAGQLVQNGSVILTESTASNYRHAREAVQGLGTDKTPKEAYAEYLGKKAAEFGLDVSEPDGVAVTRLATMLRMSTAEQAQKVQSVYDGLPGNARAILRKELNIAGTDDGIASLIYYSPALLANLQKNAGQDAEKWEDNMTLGLTTLARVYQAGRIRGVVQHAEGSGVQTILISELARAAAADPARLSSSRIDLNGDGLDVTAGLTPVVPIDLSEFPKLDNLSELPGERFAIVGMGGGSDGVQAAIFSQLLAEAGKECPAVVSIRTDRPTSQGIDGVTPSKRTLRDHGGQLAEGVYRITPETRGSGRFLEHLPAAEVPMFLVGDDELQPVTEKLQAVLDHVGGVDTVIGLDTGGDVLYPNTGHETAVATPDQDVRSLTAIKALGNVAHYCAVVATGIDAPENAGEILQQSNAAYFEPNAAQTEQVLETYKRWKMDGSDDRYFGKTPLAWQAVLASEDPTGVVTVNLPESVVTSDSWPWVPFVHAQPAMRGAFLIDLDQADVANGGTYGL